MHEADDTDRMQVCHPSSPDPPAFLTDLDAVARFDRYEATRQLILATRDIVARKVDFESADEELAANLQAAEIAAANANQSHASASTSRAAYAATPDPAPMDITPSPAPIPRHASPASPSPTSGVGSGFALGHPAHRLTAGMGIRECDATPAGPYDSQGRLPPAYSTEERADDPSSTLTRGRTTAATASNPLTHLSARAVGNRLGNALSAGRASTSRRNAVAGPSRPPAYALNEPGTSYFTMPVRPSPQNGFVEHEVIKTSTEIIDGTPCITIFDSDANTKEADDGRGGN